VLKGEENFKFSHAKREIVAPTLGEGNRSRALTHRVRGVARGGGEERGGSEKKGEKSFVFPIIRGRGGTTGERGKHRQQ